jgi:hypothetical protein
MAGYSRGVLVDVATMSRHALLQFVRAARLAFALDSAWHDTHWHVGVVTERQHQVRRVNTGQLLELRDPQWPGPVGVPAAPAPGPAGRAGTGRGKRQPAAGSSQRAGGALPKRPYCRQVAVPVAPISRCAWRGNTIASSSSLSVSIARTSAVDAAPLLQAVEAMNNNFDAMQGPHGQYRLAADTNTTFFNRFIAHKC